jgi:hypothetical protein
MELFVLVHDLSEGVLRFAEQRRRPKALELPTLRFGHLDPEQVPFDRIRCFFESAQSRCQLQLNRSAAGCPCPRAAQLIAKKFCSQIGFLSTFGEMAVRLSHFRRVKCLSPS